MLEEIKPAGEHTEKDVVTKVVRQRLNVLGVAKALVRNGVLPFYRGCGPSVSAILIENDRHICRKRFQFKSCIS